jgi:hypothetical protein
VDFIIASHTPKPPKTKTPKCIKQIYTPPKYASGPWSSASHTTLHQVNQQAHRQKQHRAEEDEQADGRIHTGSHVQQQLNLIDGQHDLKWSLATSVCADT